MNKKRGRRRKKKGETDLETVIDDFIACGRCSFFLAGYRALHGSDSLAQAAQSSDDDWLVLNWDHETRRLVQSSYGSRLDIAFYHYDGRCPECQRRFVIDGGEDEDQTRSEIEDGEEAWEETAQPVEPSVLRIALAPT